MKIIISILHFNNIDDTTACLDSLLELNLTGFDIATYVLDNGSDVEFEINEFLYKKINLKVIRINTNAGFAGGHNLIFEKIQDLPFDFLLLLNNDSILEKDSVKNLVTGATSSHADVAVPKIYFTRGYEFHKDRYAKSELGRVIWYAGGKMDWMNVMSNHVGVDEVDNGQFDVACETEFATGACLLLKKELLQKIGLFDERYFLYYEDADLNMRIKKAHGKIFYIPKSIAWHNNAGSSSSGSGLHDYYLTRNRLLFGMSYAPIKVKIHLLKQSISLFRKGRKWQRIGVRDYFLRRLGKGSFSA